MFFLTNVTSCQRSREGSQPCTPIQRQVQIGRVSKDSRNHVIVTPKGSETPKLAVHSNRSDTVIVGNRRAKIADKRRRSHSKKKSQKLLFSEKIGKGLKFEGFVTNTLTIIMHW